MATSIEQVIKYLKEQMEEQKFASQYNFGMGRAFYETDEEAKAWEKGFENGIDNASFDIAVKLLYLIKRNEL